MRKALVIGLVAVLELGAIGLMVSLRLPGKAGQVSAAVPPQKPAVAEAPPVTPVPVPAPPPPPVPVAERLRVPVLMYHEITPGPNSLYVAPEELAGHLKWLKDNGYTAITMKQLYDYYTEGKAVPEKPVVLTFDDSYSSYYWNALPLLKEYGWPGTLFVITGSLGETGHMTWDQVREAARQGTELGAHTINHPSLELLTGSRLVNEIAGSREALERETGRKIEFFCYPAGKWNEETLRVTREAGYLGAVTTQFGLAAADQDPYRWQRLRINKGTSPQGFGSLIRGAN
ncbi:MAG TPA: polysaccharide deacetylase family protein [Symbiobacteriaceae bacterium]|nr:polysaccharide deacetylase family protein [Symbiobacteriaceae bacterium]